MTQRDPPRPRVPSIDSTLRESRQSSPRLGNSNLRNETGERSRNVLSSPSPWASMSSLERIDTGQTTTTQSVDFATPLSIDTVGRPASESDSLVRQYGTSQSNRSSLIRFSYQKLRSISSHDISSTGGHSVQEELESLREGQENIPTYSQHRPRLPTTEELARLPSSLVATIIPPREKDVIEGIVVVLHDHGGNESSLREFVQEHLRPKHTACLLLRGICRIEGTENSYQWENHLDTFLRTSRLLLEELIQCYLVRECHFLPRKIIIFGHGEGAEAGLLTFLRWESVEFGGVICVGGRLIAHVRLLEDVKSRTPVLLLGGALGTTSPTAINHIQEYFSYVDDDLLPGQEDNMPSGRQLGTIKAFFAHRLQEEEWTQPATLTFDGGGIKGYGSLLILKDLMNKIGEEEKRLDGKTELSFYPSIYKLRSKDYQSQDTRSSAREGDNTQVQEPSPIPIPTSTTNLPNSSLFLPVHYFKYMSGTSTGGLISIMLSRLRMTVDDCLEEYRNLGSDVFGRPRLLTMKTLLRDKYDWKRLHQAIESVTFRHCENPHEATKWPSPEDLSRTIVVTYHDKATAEDPYLIRTFQTHERPMIRRASSMRSLKVRNAGPPQNMDIPLVGRATTAAPGYFRHLTTKIGDTTFRFKDGGFGCNNPSYETYKDISAILGNGSKDMGPFISIGTGDRDFYLFPTKQGRLRHKWSEIMAARKFPTRTKGAHDNMVHAAYRGNRERFPYTRLDGGERLGAIPMDEWKPNDYTVPALFTGKHKFSGQETLRKIEEAVTLYLAQKDVQDELKRFAGILVRRRRLQTHDESRWDRYASASWYICHHSNCPERKHDTLDGYKQHILRFHRKMSPKELRFDAQLARRCWLYRGGRSSANNAEITPQSRQL